ncbi:hypothetical protein GALMADRAFT_141562 [Galerina marginata CBS 339.88]|uniref:Uncharacterized protein n=1 Tax=Galerina marginata (strain CBS 339.88) TaxID=685588 RepID=A0A067SUD7_GALM3|nr:hypothetical protein GALMADRAFT_141562 [Galerina marginata CBS 339.88]
MPGTRSQSQNASKIIPIPIVPAEDDNNSEIENEHPIDYELEPLHKTPPHLDIPRGRFASRHPSPAIEQSSLNTLPASATQVELLRRRPTPTTYRSWKEAILQVDQNLRESTSANNFYAPQPQTSKYPFRPLTNATLPSKTTPVTTSSVNPTSNVKKPFVANTKTTCWKCGGNGHQKPYISMRKAPLW